MADVAADHIGIGTVIAGTYELTALIGQGGGGAVWAARHLRLPGKQVAIKIMLDSRPLSPETYARFRHEAEIVARLHHPNIVDVFDFNELPNGTPYIVLELLTGESLRDRIARGPLPLDATLAITRQIGSALNAAHRQHIVHRDLKPANIFLCPDDADGVCRDHVEVLDFGVSKIRGSETVRTQADVLMGTPMYMSPEQARGQNDLVDHRTDEFALGAIVYEMLSGRPAFPGTSFADILIRVVHEAPSPLGELVRGLPAHVIGCIERALEKAPDKRFVDVASFVSALTGRTLDSGDTPAALRPADTADATPAGARSSTPVVVETDAPPSGVTERVPAGILFGDLKGSTEEAELDEQSGVEKLREYERVVNQTARSFGPGFYKVKTDGDGFMATFATAHAMVECGFALQQAFRQRGWRARLGGHYGEVFRHATGDIFGADVNRAARIQYGADATRVQFLVSDAVKAIVRDRVREISFEPHPPIAAPGVREALVVFDVLPTDETERQATRAGLAALRPLKRITLPRLAGGLALSTILLVVAALLWWAHWPTQVDPQEGTGTIAVMEFENQRPDDPKDDWFGKALQTEFNTELNKIPQLPVVAPEIIQRTAKETGLDRMTAARQLGVTRFITGSFAVMGNTLRIDARIVETINGLQEAAENVEGNQEEFFSLQKQLTLTTLDHLRVRLTDAQRAAFDKPTNARLDKYRQLLGAEGVTQQSDAPAATPIGPHAQRLNDALAWTLSLWSGVAYAQASPESTETAVRQVLAEYRRAHEQGDLDDLASLYVSFPPSQRDALSAYLKGVKELKVELVDVKIQEREHDVVVSYTRRDNFIDKDTGEPMSLELRVTRFMVQDGGKWKFSGGS